MALESETADQRREGVNGLARSRDAGTDWARKVFDTIARTDSDVMVRCAAIRAMGRYPAADQVGTALKLAGGGDDVDTRTAAGPVRAEAVRLIDRIVQEGAFEEEQLDLIVGMLIERVVKESDREVRLAEIDLLGWIADVRVPGVLVGILADEDYAMRHAAEVSLGRLTGQTHDHDAAAWNAWLEQTGDPFAHAGELPEGLQRRRTEAWWE